MVLVRPYKVKPASQRNIKAHWTKHKFCKTRLTQGLFQKSKAVNSSKFIPCNAKGKILSANKYSHNVYKPILAWLSLKNIPGQLNLQISSGLSCFTYAIFYTGQTTNTHLTSCKTGHHTCQNGFILSSSQII